MSRIHVIGLIALLLAMSPMGASSGVLAEPGAAPATGEIRDRFEHGRMGTLGVATARDLIYLAT